jgi:hypothetical protein
MQTREEVVISELMLVIVTFKSYPGCLKHYFASEASTVRLCSHGVIYKIKLISQLLLDLSLFVTLKGAVVTTMLENSIKKSSLEI